VVLPASHGIPRAPCYSGNGFKRYQSFGYRTITFCGTPFQVTSPTLILCNSCRQFTDRLKNRTHNPGPAAPVSSYTGPVWAASPFARRYLGNHCCFLFLRVLRCFSSPGSLLQLNGFGLQVPQYYPRRVAPFGNLRIKACLRLPEAYRS
jgi:hypothetical protein